MNKHSQAQRFEEAGFVLNRIEALQSVLLRTQSAQQLVAAGNFTFTNNNITYHVQSGLLHATHVDNVAFSPIPPPLKANFTQFLQPPALPDQSAPINSDIIDEVLCIARHHRNADQ